LEKAWLFVGPSFELEGVRVFRREKWEKKDERDVGK
jgi:hypothetical protein